ncbi:MAG TPA: DNA-3-methyladenine glycosylase I [Mesotoga prima]|nr:DNA-3-methyladenine glycosylase I [Mesotoga prima]HOZ99533.1 DNA-3-methyladenine glycosylase I [Mesotoga prima]HQN60297.1 DNA-3-methyladenine glycosylase I [Mesotoga prima]
MVELNEVFRCPWAEVDKLYIEYHDTEWGVPLHDDNIWFEFLILEGAQAGLSWHTVLKKREEYRKAFSGFDPRVVSKYGENEITKLVENPGIIRNRKKIHSAINNAKRFIQIQEEYGTFDSYVWSFVNNKPIINTWESLSEIPSVTEKSVEISRSLRDKGFTFVGPKIVYALMEATGMVNDHLVGCFRYSEVLRCN